MIRIPHKSASKTRIHVSNHRKAPASLQYCGVKTFPSVTLWYRSIPPFHKCPAFLQVAQLASQTCGMVIRRCAPTKSIPMMIKTKTLHLRYPGIRFHDSDPHVMYIACVCIYIILYTCVCDTVYVFAYILILRLSI